MQPESAINRAMRVAICKTGRAVVVPNRIAPNAYVKQRDIFVPVGWLGGPEGSPDLWGQLYGSGRVFCIEGKTATGRLRDSQKRWAEATRRRGGFVATCRSVDEAIAALARAEQGACE